MGAGEWYVEKNNAQKEYDSGRISRDNYELRTKFAIGMIYKSGDSKDKEAAMGMAKAHAYNMQELIELVE